MTKRGVILLAGGGQDVTAEIAILNKTAVALAADSAVTISAGSNQHKIFDSADKLFELCEKDPIAIMINNDMSFMETPLPVLIKQYRSIAPRFDNVRQAGYHFLEFLDEFAKQSPKRIKIQSLNNILRPLIQDVNEKSRESFISKIIDENTGQLKPEYTEDPDAIPGVARKSLSEELDNISALIDSLPDASFIGEGDLTFSDDENRVIDDVVADILNNADDHQHKYACDILRRAALKRYVSVSSTGIIVSGFGKDEIFPTLVSFELEGVIGNRLKFSETNFVDIDREGTRARVLPFAQREMVERFLYGLDMPLRDQIANFCRSAVPRISEELMQGLDMAADDAGQLRARAARAEQAFYQGLEEDGFQAIQSSSEAEIQDMVEFMPKAEMARMAEALVNLTSIKRRVSRGFETVGGPIDVAIVSRAEGFVWVSRKHYFPRELNDRYFARITRSPKEEGSDPKSVD